MKRLVLFAIILIAACTVAMAQPRAIGGRLAYGIGASYQHGFGEKNMLQADLDFLSYGWGIQGTVTYNWIFPINSWTGPGSWNWYAGVGGGLGYVWGWRGWGGYGFAGAAGMIGVEYNFKFPLQLSLDWRPLIGPAFDKHGAWFFTPGFYSSAIGLGIRYKF
ncbi:MAG: hypothetical protein FWC37_06330 [Lentimicrobiaceae bacterium]|nr:hypothetical protein [Lentimicrobiaceae bacterium]